MHCHKEVYWDRQLYSQIWIWETFCLIKEPFTLFRLFSIPIFLATKSDYLFTSIHGDNNLNAKDFLSSRAHLFCFLTVFYWSVHTLYKWYPNAASRAAMNLNLNWTWTCLQWPSGFSSNESITENWQYHAFLIGLAIIELVSGCSWQAHM